jgi:hypothetical protein
MAVLGAWAAAPAQAQSWPVYTVSPLPMSSVSGFSDGGLLLGRGFVPCTGICTQSDVPLLYDTRTGTATALGGFVSPYGAVNAKGQLAGATIGRDAAGALVRSVVIRQVDGTVTTLAAPSMASTQTSGLVARGFNANGQMALQHSDGIDAQMPFCGNYQGWVGNGASWQALGTPDTVLHLAGLNASGVAVGSAVPAATCGGEGGGFHATVSQAGGTLVDLHGSLPGRFSRANAINDLGYAVGDYDSGTRTLPDTYNPSGVAVTRTAVWNTASRNWYDLGPATGTSRLNAVNNRGEVVGSANAQAAAGQPFVPNAGRAVLGNLATNWPLVDLNTLLANNTGGWVLQEAVAINAGGQIVARGYSPSGSGGYVLLTPVSAPADPYASAPSAPASLAASGVSATSAVLTWTPTARNATRLVVERCRGYFCTNFAPVATLTGDAARYSDASLARRTTYRWRVRAGNAAGLSAAGNVVSATTLR